MKLFLAIVTLIFFTNTKGQTFQKTDFGIKTVINEQNIEIRFYNPSTVRIIKSPVNTVVKKESLSVIEEPQNVKLNIVQKDDFFSIKSSEIVATLNLKTGNIVYTSLAGKILLHEKESGAKFTPFNDAGENTFNVYQPFVLDEDEAIYGLGQHQNGKMSQRNLRYYMIQGNTEDVIPFFVSNKGYGLYWDNYSPTTFIDNKDETSFNSEVGDCVDYYFMYGGNVDGVIAQMRSLTGQAPMLPLWTYGYWQSKERYKSQNELVDVVKKYRELGVPLDGIVQDWQYWGGNYLWNAMDFLNPEFYNPKKMVDDVHALNAHMIISIWASFGPHTKPYKELDSAKMLFNFKTWPLAGPDTWPPNPDYPSGVRVYDAYNPAARDIYWKHLNKKIFSLGMDGWWMDSSEPDHLDETPKDMDTKTYLGSFRKVRNAFPLMTVGGVYDHQRSVSNDKRVFILTRSAFAGQQRYGANTWSGDVSASWNAFKNQITAGLNFTLCAIPNWNSDLGGFFLGDFPKKLEDPNYRELYVRWLQFGVFCPMMRSHGTDAPREIYQFGKKGDVVYDAINKSINLRYALLPYVYANAWSVTNKQSTMMRGLVMDFANDKKVLSIGDEYMFGKSLLVSPVTKSMYLKAAVSGKDSLMVADFGQTKTKSVYLPAGCTWYDFWNGNTFIGGETVEKETPIDILPVFVKAGSILPIGPKVQYAAEKKWDKLEVRIYPGADSDFTLYEDEGDNYNYEKGKFTEIKMHWNNQSKTLSISDRRGAFDGMLEQRNFNVVLVDKTNGIGDVLSAKIDKVIAYNGKATSVKF